MSDMWGAATSSRCSAARGRSWARGENFLSNHTEDQIPTFILSLSDTLGARAMTGAEIDAINRSASERAPASALGWRKFGVQ
jgi:hypothetical protein